MNSPAILPLPDGTVALAYRERGTDPGREVLAGAVLGRDGQIVAAAPITGDWDELTNPALTLDGGQLRAYWGGIASASWQSPVPGLETATAASPQGPWTGQFGGIEVATCDSSFDPMCPAGGYIAQLYSYGSDISAVSTSAGPLAAWSGTLGVYVRAGTEPPRDTDAGPPGMPAGDDEENTSDPKSVSQEGLDDKSTYPAPSFTPSCCGYEPQLAVALASGRPYLGWFSNAKGRPGVLIQQVDPGSGAPVGSPATVPGSTTLTGLRGRTPLTGAPGSSDVFTAIPAGRFDTEVAAVRSRAASASAAASRRYTVISTGAGRVRNTAVAADDAGRLWIVWTRAGVNGLTVSASVADLHAGKLSPATTIAAPPNALDSYTLGAVALGAGVEIIGEFGSPLAGSGPLFHTLLMPTPAASAPALTVTPGAKATAQVSLSVAGTPVAGATVTPVGAFASAVGKRRPPSAHTNARGVARIRLGPFHRSITVRLRATKRGYAPITIRVKVHVRRPRAASPR